MKWIISAAAAAALFAGADAALAQAQRRAEPPKGTLEGAGKTKTATGRGVQVRTGPAVKAPGRPAANPEANARRALAELERTHRIRMAKLERLRRLAEKLGRTDQLRRIAAAKQKEMRIYQARKKAILERLRASAPKKGGGIDPARARAERREAAERMEMQRRRAQQQREMEERRRRAAAEKARRTGGGR